MFRLFSAARAERILEEHAAGIAACETDYGVPAPVLRAILFQEITRIDLWDVFADLAVSLYWLRYRLREALHCAEPLPLIRRGVLGKRDSSTGYAQIFARVAIGALNTARAHGQTPPVSGAIPPMRALDPAAPGDLMRVWLALRRDRAFNLACAALNLRAAAEEMTGRYSFDGCTEAELKRILTRYNANVKSVTPYGEEAYRHYLRYASPEGDRTGRDAAPDAGGGGKP